MPLHTELEEALVLGVAVHRMDQEEEVDRNSFVAEEEVAAVAALPMDQQDHQPEQLGVLVEHCCQKKRPQQVASAEHQTDCPFQKEARPAGQELLAVLLVPPGEQEVPPPCQIPQRGLLLVQRRVVQREGVVDHRQAMAVHRKQTTEEPVAVAAEGEGHRKLEEAHRRPKEVEHHTYHLQEELVLVVAAAAAAVAEEEEHLALQH
mmetsp:Transcript_873/g.1153  ORF Transcript_873/g.1153 Transcript_873/m.1153 type:complete len:205 (+) Transcript_873:867-1481(+)